MLRNENQIDYRENWPEHYYEIDDPVLRKQLLEEYLQEHPDHEESRKLLDLWNRRFSLRKNKAADRFMEAWLMLKIASQTRIGFFNRKGKEKELLKYADMLCLDDISSEMKREWRDFARTLLISCADTRAYRTAIFGLIDLGDRITAMRIAEEFDTVSRIYPAELGYEEQFAPLREILIQTYKDILRDGESLWNEYAGNEKN